MKKAFSIILSLLLLCSLAVPVMAAGETVVYTSDSSFVAGGTVKVNEQKTKQNIMDLGKNAAEYNAALEGNMQYYWFRNDSYYKDGPSITLTENDKGCQFYCKVYLFSDADRTQQCGTYDGAKFTVPNTGNPALIPEIRDAAIPDGKVGQSYYVKLDCSDPDVVFSLFRSSLPDGLYLTQHGEIEGTPTKAGFWHVVIKVTPEAGEDYANTKEFDITITEGAEEYTLELMEEPDKLAYTMGEYFDPTGMRIRIYTPDGYIDSRNGDKLTYYQEALLNTGDRKIKISYGDSFTFVYITVEAPKETVVQLLKAPNKVEYYSGETLDLTGLKVRVIKTDGTYFDSQNGEQLSVPTQPLTTLGEQKIKVAYGDSFDIFIVTVREAPTTDPTDPDTSTKPTDPDVSTKPTDPDVSTNPTDGTEAPTDGTESPTDGTESTDPTTDTTNKNDSQNDKGMPWWGILLIAFAAAGIGVAVTILVLKKKK